MASPSCTTSYQLAGPRVPPNPSHERTRNGKAPWPCNAFVYDAPHGQGALPLRAAQLKRYSLMGSHDRGWPNIGLDDWEASTYFAQARPAAA